MEAYCGGQPPVEDDRTVKGCLDEQRHQRDALADVLNNIDPVRPSRPASRTMLGEDYFEDFNVMVQRQDPRPHSERCRTVLSAALLDGEEVIAEGRANEMTAGSGYLYLLVTNKRILWTNYSS